MELPTNTPEEESVFASLSDIVRASLIHALEPLGAQWRDSLLSYIEENDGLKFDSKLTNIGKLREAIEKFCGRGADSVFIGMSVFLSQRMGLEVKPEQFKDIECVLQQVAREYVAKYPSAQTKQDPIDASSKIRGKEQASSQSSLLLSEGKEEAFKNLVVKACDETLEILGSWVRESTYSWLRANFEVEKEEIGENFPKFIETIQSMYGPGAQVILIGLATTLCRRFDIDEDFNYENVGSEELTKIYQKCRKKSMGLP